MSSWIVKLRDRLLLDDEEFMVGGAFFNFVVGTFAFFLILMVVDLRGTVFPFFLTILGVSSVLSCNDFVSVSSDELLFAVGLGCTAFVFFYHWFGCFLPGCRALLLLPKRQMYCCCGCCCCWLLLLLALSCFGLVCWRWWCWGWMHDLICFDSWFDQIYEPRVATPAKPLGPWPLGRPHDWGHTVGIQGQH